jgi:phage terminase large subunit GpA-like protein
MLADDVYARAVRSLIPPPRLHLSQWIEDYIVLPAGASALPGPMRLYEYQKEIADALSDPEIERITLVKASRIGFTALVTAAIASYITNDPAQTLVVLPTESDCRDFTISDLEPTFAATPILRNALKTEPGETERNTILSRRFAGGSLKIVPARAPRSLRRHTARLLFIDEADACEPTTEGDPCKLAEQRTTTFRDRKICIGSTPVYAETSNVLKAYAESDQRIFEVPCQTAGASWKFYGRTLGGTKGSQRPRSFAVRPVAASSMSGTSFRWLPPGAGERQSRKSKGTPVSS